MVNVIVGGESCCEIKGRKRKEQVFVSQDTVLYFIQITLSSISAACPLLSDHTSETLRLLQLSV